MAELQTQKDGLRRIRFYDADGRRKSIRIGRMPLKQARGMSVRIEDLVYSQRSGEPPQPSTTEWVNGLESRMRKKLEAVGLIKPVKRRTLTLIDWVDQYIDSRTDAKPSTITVYGHARRNLKDFFGEGKRLHEITEGDADEFRLYLKTTEKLAENTIRKRCGLAKQFVRAAMRKRLVEFNPFEHLVSTVRGNSEKHYFLKRADAEKILEHCPDAQWRLIFVLSRFGGLRCPSEHLALKWSDILWEENKIIVTSPKTAHHEGKATRVIPIFPELREPLEAVRELARENQEFVITRYRDASQNLRTTFQKIIKRAGLEPWPRLFHNLRATRETELAESFPIHVVCEWIGNSQLVAAQHYLQTTEEHFAKAACSVVPYMAPKGAKLSKIEEKPKHKNPEKHGVFRGSRSVRMDVEGLEPPASSL